MSSIRLVIRNPNGIHARPLGVFVETAGRFRDTRITVRNVSIDGPARNGKSALTMLTVKARVGQEIEVTAEGPEADAALEAIRDAVESGLGEPLS
jgi:phosphotransferase system HPr (HPr) family protein